MTTIIILYHKSYKLPTGYGHIISFIQDQKINVKSQSFNAQKIELTFINEITLFHLILRIEVLSKRHCTQRPDMQCNTATFTNTDS